MLTVHPAVRAAVRVVAEHLAVGRCLGAGDDPVRVLVAELIAAGCWSPTQRNRIVALSTDRTTAALVAEMAAGAHRSGARDRLVEHLDSTISPPVSSARLERIDVGLARLADVVDQLDDRESG
ncbi:hypothetical protein O7623_16435 [Solwaraspora sp. WMMD791]|uniref:hypothetical protein n=1 Tax=Solwaraspora sp. WMMD791 TaxID=3016086 RepID=UPI00249AC662|nr:hypothetical protein [Solwaraspora sp. WMMD791]WFE25011.1 hypothetical protein O7623_16435 [Solwaraspora sp. WMMD791]